MNGIWASLTPQGKLVFGAGILSVIIVLGLLFRGSDGQGSGAGPLILPTQAVAPTPTQEGVIGLASVTPSATLLPGENTPEPTATLETAPTAVPPSTQGPLPPTSTTSPPIEPPTATRTTAAIPGCLIDMTVIASVLAEDDTVSARLMCDGALVANATMSAFFSYETSVTTCEAITNNQGIAICRTGNASSQEGPVQSITVCFDRNSEPICNTINRS